VKPAPDAKPRLIVLAEDDRAARAGYAELLASKGYEIVEVTTGLELLNHVRRRLPDAVLTDIALPGLDGFEAAAALKADPRTRNIPIIGMTGHWSVEVGERGTSVGLAALLMKPCSPTHLAAELDRVLTSL
jgi:two-component system, cell cycle response regulator DivK